MSTRIPSAGRPGATPPPETVTTAASPVVPSSPAGPADGIDVGAGEQVFASGAVPSSDDVAGARYADRGGLCASPAAEAAIGLRTLPREDAPGFVAAIAQLFGGLDAVSPRP